MSWTVRARLLDARGAPCREADVDVCRFAIDGDPVVAAQGRSDAQGVVVLTVQGEVRSFLQRVALRIRTADGTELLAEPPARQTAKLVDFGRVVIGAARPDTGVPISVTPDATGTAVPTETEFNRLLAERVQLQQVAQEATRQVADKEAELGRVREELVHANAQLTQQNTTTVQDLAVGLGRQLETAAARLGEGGSALRLANVSVEIKGVSTGTGDALRFLKQDELGKVGGRNLSTVGLQYRLGTAGPERTAAQVPDLVGSSSERAVRVLQDAGWLVAIREQWLELPATGPNPDGRVLRQQPAAGAPLGPGESVTLTIGRATPGESS